MPKIKKSSIFVNFRACPIPKIRDRHPLPLDCQSTNLKFPFNDKFVIRDEIHHFHPAVQVFKHLFILHWFRAGIKNLVCDYLPWHEISCVFRLSRVMVIKTIGEILGLTEIISTILSRLQYVGIKKHKKRGVTSPVRWFVERRGVEPLTFRLPV